MIKMPLKSGLNALRFFTAYPSKYERKPEDQKRPRQGSTEAECYNELKCSDYCCVDPSLQHKEGVAFQFEKRR